MNDTNTHVMQAPPLVTKEITYIELTMLAALVRAPLEKLLESARDANYRIDTQLKCLVSRDDFIAFILEFALDRDEEQEGEADAMIQSVVDLIPATVFIDLAH